MKKTILKEISKVSRIAANGGGGLPTWLGFYEPPCPELLNSEHNDKRIDFHCKQLKQDNK